MRVVGDLPWVRCDSRHTAYDGGAVRGGTCRIPGTGLSGGEPRTVVQ